MNSMCFESFESLRPALLCSFRGIWSCFESFKSVETTIVELLGSFTWIQCVSKVVRNLFEPLKIVDQNYMVVSGPAEAKLNWSGRVRDCVLMHAAARGVLRGNLMFWNRFWGHFGPFFSLICSSRQAGFWFNSARLYASNIIMLW